jgi:hypothetical protein
VGIHLPRSNLEDIIIAKVCLDAVLEAQPSRGGEAIRVWGRGIVGDGRRGPSTSHDLLFNLHCRRRRRLSVSLHRTIPTKPVEAVQDFGETSLELRNEERRRETVVVVGIGKGAVPMSGHGRPASGWDGDGGGRRRRQCPRGGGSSTGRRSMDEAAQRR